jgi:hypothetical protein
MYLRFVRIAWCFAQRLDADSDRHRDGQRRAN